MTVASPTPFHTSTNATDSSAYEGSVSQPGPSIPNTASVSLITPPNGSISTWKVIPMPIVLTSTGKNTTERRKPRAMICEVSSTPSSSPSTTLSPDVTTPKITVLTIPVTSA